MVNYFRNNITAGPVQKVYIIGASEGGLIAAMLLERHPNLYHGGISLCGPVGGMPYQIKYLGDFSVVFDYFFPQIFDFKMADIPADAYLQWDDYQVEITQALESDPKVTNQLFNVTKAARDKRDPTTAVTTVLVVLSFNIFGMNDMIDVTGGQPYDNQSTRYKGAKKNSDLNAHVERVQSDQGAVDYLLQFYQTTGLLQRPFITLHTTLDELVPFEHEKIYSKMVSNAGQKRFLTVLSARRYGHCNFTLQEMLKAFALLVTKAGGKMEMGLESYLLLQSDLTME